MKNHDDFEDDGRTIADMSGLETSHSFMFRKRPRQEEKNTAEARPWEETSLSWKERLQYIGGALAASLLIALVFLAGIALVIWLITLYA